MPALLNLHQQGEAKRVSNEFGYRIAKQTPRGAYIHVARSDGSHRTEIWFLPILPTPAEFVRIK